MAQTPPVNPSTDEDDENYRGLTAYDSLNKGEVTSNESSLGEEGLTTSRVNHAATDDSGSDADESREHRTLSNDANNSSELYPDSDPSTVANRPPLPNGDTGYAG